MTAYRYRGFDAMGKSLSGEISAASPEEAERRLSFQQISIISLDAVGRGGAAKAASRATQSARKGLGGGGGKVTDADSASVLRNLAVMTEAGVPFVEALDAVAASSRTPLLRSRIDDVRTSIVGGQSLSSAMAQSSLFPRIVGDMLKVAEEGGKLDATLSAAADHLERAVELRKRVMNAMLYPMVTVSISILTVAALIVFVIPQFSQIFAKLKADLPITTKWMLATSSFVRGNPLITIVGILVLIVGIRIALKLPAVGNYAGRLMLRVPGLGTLLRNLSLSRSFHAVSTLIGGNVSLLAALEHGARIAGNPAIEDALLASRKSVEAGKSFSDALEETKAFPPTLVQIVGVGERTGRLGPLMESYSQRMEQDVDARLKSLVSIIEPLMIVVMGCVVGVIVVSIILPLYSVAQNIK